MADLLCKVCGEPWDAWGLHHGDVMAWEARAFKRGDGCPCCKGVSPEGETAEQREERELAALQAASSNWDDPDSFPMVLDAFAEAVGVPPKARRPWKAPTPKVLWTCAGCSVQAVKALRYSLSEENSPGLRLAWQGGEKVHFSHGRAYTYADHPNADNWPDETAPHTIDGKPYCSLCAQTCDGDDCKASVFQRTDLEGDTYDTGHAFTLEGDYDDAYCLECYERLDAERMLEAAKEARIDLARDAWRAREIGYSNAEVRTLIEQRKRRIENGL